MTDKKTIVVTVPASHERKLWKGNDFIEFGQHKERRPMIRATTIQEGRVLVEIDVARIVSDIAVTAMENRTKKASALSGRIRAKVLEHETTETSEPSPWAGPIEVWTRISDSRWNEGEELVRFEPVNDPHGRPRSELEDEGWTYETTIQEGGRK